MRVGSYPYNMSIAKINAGEDVVKKILEDIELNLNKTLGKIIITGVTIITSEDNMVIINDDQNARLVKKDEETFYVSFDNARITSMKFLKNANIKTITFYYL